MTQKIIITLILILFTIVLPAQVNTEMMRNNKDENGFNVAATYSMSLKAGNSEQIVLKQILRVDYRNNLFYSFLIGSIEYGKINRELDTNKAFAHLRGGIKLFCPNLYGELFIQKEYNEFLLLLDRNLAGASLRIRLLDKKWKTKGKKDNYILIYIAPGAMFEHEKLDNDIITAPTEEVSKLMRMTNYISGEIGFESYVKLSAVFYYQPAFYDFQDFRLLQQTTLAVTITKYLSLTVEFSYRYDRKPPVKLVDGAIVQMRHFDLELLNGVKIAF